MGLTGALIVALGVAGLTYLVPWLAGRREESLADEAESLDPFSRTMTIVRRGGRREDDEFRADVSTSYMRQASIRELRAGAIRAAARRRIVLLVLLASLVVVVLLSLFGRLQPAFVAIPGGVVALFFVACRRGVVRMRKKMDKAITDLDKADDEATVVLVLTENTAAATTVELTRPVVTSVSLLDPIPITTPIYVSKPMASRTVRTIDLSAPVPRGAGDTPVVAESLREADSSSLAFLHAVGE